MDETALPVPTADGRLLTAAAFGPHDGYPVVWLHGSPGSRLLSAPDLGLLDRAGVRLVTYDRPGYGGSTRRPGRTVGDVVVDVVTVAGALALQRFAVAGWSGGGPHALAVAALAGDRVTRCAALSSVAPLDAPGLDWFAGMSPSNVEEFDAALSGEGTLEPALTPVAAAVSDDVYAFIAALRAELPDVDRAALDEPAMDRLIAASMAEALRPGADGWIDDDLAFCRPWGFDPSTIRVPVGVWHGTEDTLVPVAHAGWLTQAIRGSQGHLLTGTGHFGVLDELPDVLSWLVG